MEMDLEVTMAKCKWMIQCNDLLTMKTQSPQNKNKFGMRQSKQRSLQSRHFSQVTTKVMASDVTMDFNMVAQTQPRQIGKTSWQRKSPLKTQALLPIRKWYWVPHPIHSRYWPSLDWGKPIARWKSLQGSYPSSRKSKGARTASHATW